jgi:hypothetical protein
MTEATSAAPSASDVECPPQAIRAVLDTNVPIAAHLSRNPHSPTVELLGRWRAGQFLQLYSE